MTAEDRAAHVEREAVAGVLAKERCADVHGGLRYLDACAACRGWGNHLADAVLAALPQTGDAAVEWADTLRNDGEYEYTVTGDCHGTWEQTLRRRPATKPGAWEKVAATPVAARYPHDAAGADQ